MPHTETIRNPRPQYPVPISAGQVKPADVVAFGGYMFVRDTAGPWQLVAPAEAPELYD